MSPWHSIYNGSLSPVSSQIQHGVFRSWPNEQLFLDFMVHQRAKLFPGLFSGLLIVTNSVSQVLVKDIN